jgi:hypothetical protein
MSEGNRMHNHQKSALVRRRFLATLTLLAPLTVAAADFSVSGFGTVGYARSDQSFAYQRFIDDNGTFKRDSVFGVQLDAKFSPQWSATVQAKAAPSLKSDSQWDATLAWAFVSWRPSNDWLLRLGKLRIPLYLNSENMDVGTTFDYARLPTEMYSMAPTLDFTGASFTKSWELAQGELSLDGYWGKTKTQTREYLRDGVPAIPGMLDALAAGPAFMDLDVTARGLALTYRVAENTFRFGLHKATAAFSNGLPFVNRPTFVTNVPFGVSYYDFRAVPGIESRKNMEIPIVNVSADIGLGNDVRLAAEYAVRKTTDMDRGLNSKGGYISLRRPFGAWTPYTYYARLRSESRMIDLYQTVNKTSVPAFVPFSTEINASQRVVADTMQIFDQHSWAVGTSYSLTPTSKLKAEWMRTTVGVASSLVDAPPGSDVSHKSINVLSMSYNFVF